MTKTIEEILESYKQFLIGRHSLKKPYPLNGVQAEQEIQAKIDEAMKKERKRLTSAEWIEKALNNFLTDGQTDCVVELMQNAINLDKK